MNEKLLKILRVSEYPHALEKQYPRVLNKLLNCGYRRNRSAFRLLMVDDRGDRAGFPCSFEIFYLS